MTPAERQARRRQHLVDRRPALAALVDLAEADERLRELRRSEAPDPAELNRADLKRAQATGDLALALGVSEMWARRQLRRRGWIAKGWLPSDVLK
ncbi:MULTISPECIES: hypothetical protein [unclassified Aureimonas]|uniref:hypothetical protein n=1 Tax=unclassified Aureimonas TaxID=2615206 RepID=UPI00078260F7|nr:MULTISPECIES: hypothetical protein [unclassified Aureimonas]